MSGKPKPTPVQTRQPKPLTQKAAPQQTQASPDPKPTTHTKNGSYRKTK